MIVTDELLHPLLREIDAYYYTDKVITPQEADDLITAVTWIVGKEKLESNIQQVIRELRGLKTVIDEKTVSKVINGFRKICG